MITQVEETAPGGQRIPWLVDVAGLAWIVAAAVAVMLPALVHGVYLGDFDWLAANGLPHQNGVTLPNSDRILQMIPWTTLAWTQVHAGHLPLWNPYNALGTPLAFNWQSSTFSLPAALGYLVPMRLAYTVQVLVTLVVAGSGGYFLCRVLRLAPLACVLAGTVFELSGSFMGWLGWPVASVASWSGWIFAATILVVRGNHRVGSITLFSITLALAVYAGQPDTLVLLLILLVLFAIVLLVQQVKTASLRGLRVLTRPCVDLGFASLAGLAISAPLLLPGLQLMSKSIRSGGGGALGSQAALALKTLQPLIFPGLGQAPPFWIHLYLGVVAASLAVVALASVVLGYLRRCRRPEVVALVAVAIGAGLLTFAEPVVSAMNHVPGLEAVRFPRILVFWEFSIAMLAGAGLDVLVRFSDRRRVLLVSGAAFLVAGLVLAVSVAVGPSDTVYARGQIVWAVAGVLLGLGLVAALAFVRRHNRRSEEVGNAVPAAQGGAPGSSWITGIARKPGLLAGAALLAFESVFLVTMGGPIWPSSAHPVTVTAAERELQRTVGSSLVGSGLPSCAALGFTPNTNILFDVHEMKAYDPMLPRSYFQEWFASTGQVAGLPYVSSYCPGFKTSAEARTYGVSFVLEPHGSAGPTGASFVREIGGEDVYRIPGSAMATVTPARSSGRRSADTAPESAATVSWVRPNSLQIVSVADTPQILRIRLTNVPGWHASIDGRSLPLEAFDRIMLQAHLPAGRHVVELTYWPRTFSLGIVLAALGCASLVVLLIVALAKRRRAAAPRDTGPA